MKVFDIEGKLIAQIEPPLSYSSGKFRSAVWTAAGDLCLWYDKRCIIYLGDENFKVNITEDFIFYGGEFGISGSIYVYDSVIVQTLGFTTTPIRDNTDFSRFYSRNSTIKKGVRHFLPDGVHYLEESYGAFTGKCVNSLNDSVVWECSNRIHSLNNSVVYDCSSRIVKMASNRKVVAIGSDCGSGFKILDTKDGRVIYENDSSYFYDFLTDDIIRIGKNYKEEGYSVVGLDSEIYNLEDSVFLASGSICEYYISNGYLAYIRDSVDVVITNIKNVNISTQFPLPKKKYARYILSFSPCAKYIFLSCFNPRKDNGKVKYDDIDHEILVIDIEKKRIKTFYNCFAADAFFIKEGKYAVALWGRCGFVYDLKSLSIVKTLLLEEEVNFINGYLSNNVLWIDVPFDRNGYELDIKNWILKESQYRSVRDYNDFLILNDEIICDKKVFLSKGKVGRSIKYVCDELYSYPVYINDSVLIFNNRESDIVQIMRTEKELIRLLKELVGGRELSQYEIDSYDRLQ